jgi:tetratricopeptide (TPR) repeat protein
MERASRKPTERLDAYDLYLRALAEVNKPHLEGYGAALLLLQRALAIDSAYAPAASLVAGIRHQQRVSGVLLTNEEISEALKFARLAIETGRDDPDALSRAANALAMLAGENAAAVSAIERALTLNPNSAYAWWACGTVHCYANRPDAAIPAIQRAMRLSPLDPIGYSFKSVLAYALMLDSRHQNAMEWIDRSLHDRPRSHFAVRIKVALCGYLGRTEEARFWVARLLELNPDTTIAGFKGFSGNFLSPGTIAVWEEGFRRAGLPPG